MLSSPRPWGCFFLKMPPAGCQSVFPTPVGVFLFMPKTLDSSKCLPHARGGVSVVDIRESAFFGSSPRPWGCFWKQEKTVDTNCVFPTPVGVFLPEDAARRMSKCLPHARGGVSPRTGEPMYIPASSPRPWGCFLAALPSTAVLSVFPTPVGVFPKRGSTVSAHLRLPHARGGVSSSPGNVSMRGTVFPTPVGVFPRCSGGRMTTAGLPHARGGVSFGGFSWATTLRSSPRPWGCF